MKMAETGITIAYSSPTQSTLYLSRTEPEGPLALEVLEKNSEGSLHRTENSSVDNDWTLLGFLTLACRLVSEVEANRQLEIELNSGCLMDSVQAILDLDIDLGTVEGTITRIDLPVALSSELIQRLRELSLRLVPELQITHGLLRTSREGQLRTHAKDIVDLLHKVKRGAHFLLDLHPSTCHSNTYLLLGTEDVAIILLEATDTSETIESTRELITVEDTKVRETERKVSVGTASVLEHEAVTGAVHGLETVLGIITVEEEHIVSVVVSMTRDLPEIKVEDVGGDDFLQIERCSEPIPCSLSCGTAFG